jgi:hypothetical protein
MQHCFYCGEELGVYEKLARDYDTCGARECEREARDAYAADDDNARYEAERDGYERYRQ